MDRFVVGELKMRRHGEADIKKEKKRTNDAQNPPDRWTEQLLRFQRFDWWKQVVNEL